jgi:hypothetical protein
VGGWAKRRQTTTSGGEFPPVKADRGNRRTTLPPRTQATQAISAEHTTHTTFMLNPTHTERKQHGAHPKSKAHSSPSIAVSPSISVSCCSAFGLACEHGKRAGHSRSVQTRSAVSTLGRSWKIWTDSVRLRQRKMWMKFAGLRPGPALCGLYEATGTRTGLPPPPTRQGGHS